LSKDQDYAEIDSAKNSIIFSHSKILINSVQQRVFSVFDWNSAWPIFWTGI